MTVLLTVDFLLHGECEITSMNDVKNLSEELETHFPSSKKELVRFPSGAYMFYFFVANEEYVLEYLPSLKCYGVSKVSNATYGWEGVENSFEDFEAAKRFVWSLLKGSNFTS